MTKLEKLVEIEGYDSTDELLEAVFSDAINLKTAKRLNLDIPATVLALADAVIE